MAFKMKGKPTIQGTAQHYKELKVVREATDNLPDGRSKSSPFQKKGDPYAEAKKKDPNLDKYIAVQKATTPGSEEYEANQAKINAAYGKVRSKSLKAAQIKKVEEAKPEVEVVEKKEEEKKEVTPKEPKYTAKTKYQIKQEKKAGKDKARGEDTPGGEEITRAEKASIKTQKLASKKETALAEGKSKKAARLYKREQRKAIKAEKLASKATAREKGEGTISAADRKAIKTQKLKSKYRSYITPKKRERLGKRIERRETSPADKKAKKKERKLEKNQELINASTGRRRNRLIDKRNKLKEA